VESSSGPTIFPGHHDPFLRRTHTIDPTLKSPDSVLSIGGNLSVSVSLSVALSLSLSLSVINTRVSEFESASSKEQ
jgi:hypothetical protein